MMAMLRVLVDKMIMTRGITVRQGILAMEPLDGASDTLVAGRS